MGRLLRSFKFAQLRPVCERCGNVEHAEITESCDEFRAARKAARESVGQLPLARHSRGSASVPPALRGPGWTS